MNNESIVRTLIILQLVSFSIVHIERDQISKDWKQIKFKKKIGYIFMMFLPLLTLISLIIRPL